jgi:hypothetical protein
VYSVYRRDVVMQTHSYAMRWFSKLNLKWSTRSMFSVLLPWNRKWHCIFYFNIWVDSRCIIIQQYITSTPSNTS